MNESIEGGIRRRNRIGIWIWRKWNGRFWNPNLKEKEVLKKRVMNECENYAQKQKQDKEESCVVLW